MATSKGQDRAARFVEAVMAEVEGVKETRALKPANANPWYVLMTLYGEQDGEGIDAALHKENRAAWNAWSCQAMTAEQREVAAKSSKVSVAELSAWPKVKDEVENRHSSEWKARNPGVDYPGLPEVGAEVYLNGVTFAHPVVMAGAVFSGAARFGSATFSGAARFGSATFSGDAGFRSATFSGDAQFVSTTFSGDARFVSATFSGDAKFVSATFSGDAQFVSATFSGAARFVSATFSGYARFVSATFSGYARFRSATFRGEARFDSATFSRAARFGSVTFSGDAWFNATTFSGDARFNSTTFSGDGSFGSATFSGDASFGYATFSGYARFGSATFSGAAWFNSTIFSGAAQFGSAAFSGFAYFSKAIFGQADGNQKVLFADCQFEKPTSFRDATFHSRYPDFAGAVLHANTAFTDHPDHWPKGQQSDPAQAKAACAAIRHNLGKQGLPEAEHFFFRREMGFAGQIGGWWQRLPYRAFGVVSDYGYSIARPAAWLFWVWFLPIFAFAASRVTGTPWADIFEALWAAALSFANLFPVFGFHRVWFDAGKLAALSPWLKALAGAQTVVSLPLLFFLGLGLRTRFRMR